MNGRPRVSQEPGVALPDGATQTAVVVAVPQVEPFVARHRARFDASAAKGVPAHVTVLYPFVPPEDVTPQVLERLDAVVGSVRRFDCVFERTAWFGDDVAWLRPDPSGHDAFVAFTRALWWEFPEQPPYGGAFGDEVTPHLTLGESRLGGVDQLRAAVADVEPHLPVRVPVHEAVLLAGGDAPDSWRVVRRLPLA